MTSVWYCNIAEADEKQFGKYFNFLTGSVTETGYAPDAMLGWKKNQNNELFIENWFPFSSSYSGNSTIVTFGYDDSDSGIDVEKYDEDLNVIPLPDYFCYEEKDPFNLKDKNVLSKCN